MWLGNGSLWDWYCKKATERLAEGVYDHLTDMQTTENLEGLSWWLTGAIRRISHWTMTCRRGWLEWESLSHSQYNGICRSSFPYPPGTHGAANPWRTTWRNLLLRRSSFTSIPLSNQNGKWWTSSVRYVLRKVHVDGAGHKWGIWGLAGIHLVDLLLAQAPWWSSLTSNSWIMESQSWMWLLTLKIFRWQKHPQRERKCD